MVNYTQTETSSLQLASLRMRCSPHQKTLSIVALYPHTGTPRITSNNLRAPPAAGSMIVFNITQIHIVFVSNRIIANTTLHQVAYRLAILESISNVYRDHRAIKMHYNPAINQNCRKYRMQTIFQPNHGKWMLKCVLKDEYIKSR